MPALSKKSKAATARRAAQQLAVLIGDEEVADDYFDEDIWEVRYSYPELKAMVPITLEEMIPIATVRRQARHCYRFMSAYRMGLQGPLADYAMKKYSSHRRIPEGVLAEIQQQYVVDLEKKLKRKMKK